MRLEGSLDAFSLPDILQLLAFTQKTGALVLRRPGGEGVVRVLGGSVSGASADTGRQALGRRLVGAGLVDDEDLSTAVDAVRAAPEMGLGRALVDTGAVSEDTLKRIAGEQAADAVSELLRWTEGNFAFVLDAPDPDGVTLELPVETVVSEGRARLDQWPALAAQIPASSTVLAFALNPSGDPTCARDEWSLLALVDGRRTVAEIVELAGWGEFAVIRSLAGLVERGLLVRSEEGDGGLGALLRRQELVRGLEGRPASADLHATVVSAEQDAQFIEPTDSYDDPYAATADGLEQAFQEQEPAPEIVENPFLEAYPTIAGQVPQQASASSNSSAMNMKTDPSTGETRRFGGESPGRAGAEESIASGAWDASSAELGLRGAGASFADVARAVVGATAGSAAMAPAEMPDPVPNAVDRDSAVTKSLLLRLIAGVRGL